MAGTAALTKAKKEKNDEFYTQLADIENELKHYKPHFKNKTVFCNCDDPRVSNFFKYFVLNFEVLGLKRLICTCYKRQNADLFSQGKNEKAVFFDLTPHVLFELKTKNNGVIDPNIFPHIIPQPLDGDGDFRSPECVELLKQSDIVCTNPPFSLFREYVAQLIKYNKKFLIIGNQNAITYKEIFPLIRDNRLWLGYKGIGDMAFEVPESTPPRKTRFWIDENGKKWRSLGNAAWFTNLDHTKRYEELPLYKKYSPEEYPKYDNYDAIEVSKVDRIPEDYNGVMGVPISFLGKFCPKQFDIVAFRKGNDGRDLVFTREREREYNRTSVSLYNVDSRDDKERRGKDKRSDYLCANYNKTQEPIDRDFPLSTNLKNGLVNDCTVRGRKTYVRLLIRKKDEN